MIKVLEGIGPEGASINIIKAIYDKPTANTIITRKTQSNSIKIRGEIELPTIPTSFQYSAENTTQSNRQKKEMKGLQIGKEEVNHPYF